MNKRMKIDIGNGIGLELSPAQTKAVCTILGLSVEKRAESEFAIRSYTDETVNTLREFVEDIVSTSKNRN